jgi:hypothetical protein
VKRATTRLVKGFAAPVSCQTYSNNNCVQSAKMDEAICASNFLTIDRLAPVSREGGKGAFLAEGCSPDGAMS